MDKESILLDHIRNQFDAQKTEIKLYYSNLKLTLPTYIKALTIGELRGAGATIDTHITIPQDVELKFRSRANVSSKKLAVQEKMLRIQSQARAQIIAYYKDQREKLSEELRCKTLGELTPEDWLALGIQRYD